MKIVVDRNKCSSIGLCEATADDIFQIGPDGALHILMDEVPESRRIDLEQACENCPTQALSIED
jgi:ferredoxin